MAKPRLGQHFLCDTRFLANILQAAELSDTDGVIEVGPGKGVLTKALVKHAGHVLAMEVDERLANRLHEKMQDHANLEIKHEDARRANWEALAQGLQKRGMLMIKLVANLPYYLATKMVIQVLANAPSVSRLVVMVQEEVARRICASPGGKEYSAYSVAIQFFGNPRFICKVPPMAFDPPPRVSSAVVCIQRRLAPPVQVLDTDRFLFLVHAMFTHRRKTLRKCLQGTSHMPPRPVWEQALHDAGLDSQRRPETLSMEEMARLARGLDVFFASQNHHSSGSF